jgi:hypothetical protein
MLKCHFETKMNIVTNVVDLCEILASQGNSNLCSILPLANSLRKEIDALSKAAEEGSDQLEQKIRSLLKMMDEIGNACLNSVPFLNLAIASSGYHVTTNLPPSLSPSLLLKASCLLNENRISVDSDFQSKKICLTTLKLYSLFKSSSRAKGLCDWTWTEEFPKCVGFVQCEKNFSFDFILQQDLNDGRYHEELEQSQDESEEFIGGKIKKMNVTDIVKMFYANSGSLLKIEDSKSPVLILKVSKQKKDQKAIRSFDTPDRLKETWFDWFALEISDDEDVKDSKHLCLLQYVLRLAQVEMVDDCPHFDLCDEKLSLFLSMDSNENSNQPPIHSVKKWQREEVESPLAKKIIQMTPRK